MARYPTYLPTDFVKQDDKARFKSYLDGFKPLGSDYEPTKAAPDLFTEAARIAREKGYDDDAGRVAQAILRTEGALSGEIGDAGKSHGPYQFHESGMLPAYAKALGMDVRGAAEHARRNPTHAIDWALGGYLGNAIREGQAKGLRGAELATYAQQHGQRSQAPERAGQNYSAMFGGGAPIPAHAPTTVGPREAAIPAHTPVDDKAEFGKYLSSFPELGSDLQMGKERAIPAHEPKDDKQAFGDFLKSFPPLGGDLLGEAAKQLPFVGPAVQNIGKVVEPLGEAMNWYGRNVQGPQMEAIHRAGLESGASESLGEPFAVQRGMAAQPLATLLPTAVRDISESGGLPEWWKNLTETYEQRPEDFPGQKGVAELAVPSEIAANVITEPAAIGRAAKGVAEAAGKALPEAGRLAKQGAKEYFARTADAPLGLGVKQVGEEAPTKRYYHGTGSAFDAPDAAKFDPNGLYGPGYYLTDNPEVAGSYAAGRAGVPHYAKDIIEPRKKQLWDAYALLANEPEGTDLWKWYKQLVEQREAAYNEALGMFEKQGQQTRAIDVPQDLRLLDADAPTPKDLQWLIREADVDPSSTFDEVYNTLPVKSYVWQEQGSINKALAESGYDGIRYQGGQRIPMKDAEGQSIFHEAVVIFPESLPKIRNAISGTPMGMAPETVGGAIGGAYEYATSEGLSPEERAKRVALGIGVGATGGHVLTKGARGKIGLSVEDVSKQAGTKGAVEEARNSPWPWDNLPEVPSGEGIIRGERGAAYHDGKIYINESTVGGENARFKRHGVPLREAVIEHERMHALYGDFIPDKQKATLAKALEAIEDSTGESNLGERIAEVLTRYRLAPDKLNEGERQWADRVIRQAQSNVTPAPIQEPLTKPPAIKGKGEKVEQPKAREAAETVAEEGAEQGVQQVQGDEGGVPRGAPVEPPTVAVEPPKGESWLPTVKPTKKVIEAAYNPDWLRRLADKLGGTPLRRLTPGLGIQDITKKGEQTLADVGQVLGMPKRDVFTEATVLRESIMADWKSGVVGATSRLRSQGDTKGLFKVDKDGLADIAGTKVPINDVLEYPGRYNLSSEQRAYAETMHRLYDEQKLALAGEGIEIRELGFDVGGHYVGRRVLGKVDAQGNVEIGEIVGTGGKRIGAKMGFEKGRQFKTQAEAIKEGFRYLTPEETLQMNLEAAGRRIADKRMADYVLERIPYRTGAAPEELKLARDFAKDKLFAVAKLKAVVNRGYRGERVPTNVITSIGRFFPDQAKGLIEAGITRPENIITRAGLQQVEAAIPNLKTQSQAAYYKAQNVLTKAGEKARQPKYGEGTVQTPAFQAKFFSAEDAKKLRQILDLEKPAPLRGLAQSISYVNALPRLLLTTYDIGTPLIHGQIALFSHPIVWGKATGRMAQALVSEKGYQTFLKTHADTIQKWSQDGAIFTSSEFTEAAQPGRLTSKIPGIKQFGRGFEGLLNASRIYGLEATEHMAKTQQDRTDLAKFWNEMSGVVNTARMGISPTQRELETAILFAPRYRRAMLTLMTDIAKGGLRGQMARDAVGKATVAGLLGYVGVAYALGQQPHLDPREGGKFLTVEIAGQNVGLGGAFYSTSRTLLQMALEPEKAPEIATKYVQYSLSPTVGTAIDIYQKPYLYQGALKLTERVLAENLTPFWTQAMLLDEQEGSEAAAATAMEFAGLRTFPVKEDLTGLTPFQKKLRQTDKSGLTPFQKRLQGAESGGLTPFQKRLQGNSQEGVTPFQKRLGVGAR